MMVVVAVVVAAIYFVLESAFDSIGNHIVSRLISRHQYKPIPEAFISIVSVDIEQVVNEYRDR